MITLSLAGHLDKVLYLLSLFLPVALFFFAGLGLAWWLWHHESSRFREALDKNKHLSEDLNEASLEEGDLSVRFSEVFRKQQGRWKRELALRDQRIRNLTADPNIEESRPVPAFFEEDPVEVDPKYGILYTERPEEIDNLKYISGVAKVLEEKLHKAGLYRFKQIAMWTPEQVTAFSEDLGFPGRIERDEWVQQAANYHAEKYGES